MVQTRLYEVSTEKGTGFCLCISPAPRRNACAHLAKAIDELALTVAPQISQNLPDSRHFIIPIGTYPESEAWRTGMQAYSRPLAIDGMVYGLQRDHALRGLTRLHPCRKPWARPA